MPLPDNTGDAGRTAGDLGENWPRPFLFAIGSGRATPFSETAPMVGKRVSGK
jgi:hypothetical protein